jgi:hypothetical protein
MKYNKEDYSIENNGFYGLCDEDIECYNEKLVKCRKEHDCMGGCNKSIKKGEYAIRETGFMDGRPISSYTCVKCIEGWLDEINSDE